MKKVSRFAITSGIVLTFIALAWSSFSWQRIHDDIQQISHKDYTTKQATFDSLPIQNISVDVDNLTLVIKTQADSSRVTVDYFETKADKFAVTSANGTVSITQADTTEQRLFCFFRCVGTSEAITVYVPATSAYAYDLTSNNGSVTFANAHRLQAKAIQIVSSNSSVTLRDISATGAVDLQSDNGSIELRDVAASERLMLESSNASNELVRVQAPNINSRTDNGGATLDTVTTKNLTVRTSNASITLNRLSAEHSTLTSDNGSVDGDMVGPKDDYDIRIGSSNGSIQVNGKRYDESYFSDGDKATKSLSVTASNASVNISFVK